MIKLDQSYSDYVDVLDPKYPGGKAVNASTTDSVDGTPILADLINDIYGTRQAIFKEGFGDVSSLSGVPDDATNSDVLKAIKVITQKYTDSKVSTEALARVSGDTNTLNAAKKYINEKLILFFKNHPYIQYPGFPKPEIFFNFKGHRWGEVNFNGVFFRAVGKNVIPFNTGEQTDTMRDINGETEIQGVTRGYTPTGIFSLKKRDYISGGFSESNDYITKIKIDLKKAIGASHVGDQMQPRHKSVRYWILEKI